MTRYILNLMSLCCIFMIASCSEHLIDDEDNDADWQPANEEFFQTTLATAKSAISAAKAQYGVQWEEHCEYRLFRNFALADASQADSHDSIVVKILETSDNTVAPFYTDTVRYNYIGRLIPTWYDPEGEMFSHSGPTIYPADIFSPTTCVPYKACISTQITGIATALMQMHIGDRWIITLPHKMGYSTSGSGNVPGYSTLRFEVQMKGIYHPGTPVPDWR